MTYITEIVAATPDEGLHKPIIALQGEPTRDSRNGPTLEFHGPAAIVWTHPLRRVMFDPVRDCNPFFALFEAIWMLGGGHDLASLLYFNSKFGQYSDDGKFVRGSAYGVRWRSWFGHDQIEAAKRRVDQEGINTRRLVIMQWDAATDPVVDSKDVPCNTQCCLLLRDGRLDLTVFNRSNDAIYGAAGSNIVHFSMFLEYMAKLLGVPMGIYYQISNCFHGYTEFPIYQKIAPGILDGSNKLRTDYEDGLVEESPMFGFFNEESIEDFDADCNFLLGGHARVAGESDGRDGLPAEVLTEKNYRTTFFQEVVLPMMVAWKIRKNQNSDAARDYLGEFIEGNPAPYDWHVAGYEWLDRRSKTPGRIVP